MKRLVFLLGLSFSLLSLTYSQTQTSKYCYELRGETLIIPDSLIAVWETLEANVSTTALRIDTVRQTVLLTDTNDSVPTRICLRTIRRSFFEDFTTGYEELILVDSDETNQDTTKQKEIPAIGQRKSKVTKAGSLSRGVSFGNRQSVVVNSALNLQLEGELTDNLFIEANITDQNIPFQPEGNTQNVQDLDNVYIKLFNDDFALTAGDIVLQNDDTYFLKYLKNVQGGALTVKKEYKQTNANLGLAGSIAKGKFASIDVTPIDGVQGPYQVNVPASGAFTVIIANSEKVFLNGVQLTRGFDQDYVIDYNLSEITFTTNVIITGFSRIRVDVEYVDQNYSRSIVSGNADLKNGKTALGIDFYQERDNPRRPLAFDLTQEEQNQLAEFGDALDQAVVSSIDTSDFDVNQVMYALVDTVVADRTYEVLVFSTNQELARYTASFSELPMGEGNYIREETTVNGQVFKWVAPVDGVAQGNFEPLISIPTPNSKRIIDLQLDHQFSEKHQLNAELALSDEDKNLYSTINDDDNAGQAGRIDYQFKAKIKPVFGLTKMSATTRVEYLSDQFTPIDRFRDVDFDRSWGINRNEKDTANDLWLSQNLKLSNPKNQSIAYTLGHRTRGDDIEAYKHELAANGGLGKFSFKIQGINTRNQALENQSLYRKLLADLSIAGQTITPGYTIDVDQTIFSSPEKKDSIALSPLYYTQHSLYLKQAEASKLNFRLEQFIRKDQIASEGILRDTTTMYITELRVAHRQGANNIEGLLSYRNIRDSDQDTAISNNLMATLLVSKQFLNDAVSWNLNYNAIQSRELNRAFTFVQVNAGEGTHTWRDENSDGNQDLTEFYEAINVDERNYIKVFLPTNDYTLAFGNLLNTTLSIRPVYKRDAFLTRFSTVTALLIDQKDDKDNFLSRLNPFSSSVRDDQTLAGKRSIRQTIFFNQRNPKYGLDFTFLNSERKTLLNNGSELLGNKELSANQRWRVKPNYTIFTKLKQTNQQSESEFLSNRNYYVQGRKLSLQLQWQPSVFFRLNSTYGKGSKVSENTTEAQSAHSDEFTMDARWNRGGRQTLNAGFTFKEIRFDGIENTALSYVLLDALRPGANTLWHINVQMKLINGLQLTLSYNGRKSAGAQAVNIGQMRVTALF